MALGAGLLPRSFAGDVEGGPHRMVMTGGGGRREAKLNVFENAAGIIHKRHNLEHLPRSTQVGGKC